MTFEELWEQSIKFRIIFYDNGVCNRGEEKWKPRLKELWENRYPKIEWSICPVDGCTNLVKEGEYCKDHYDIPKKMPTWQFVNGVLYRLLSIVAESSTFVTYPQGTFRSKDYKIYDRHLAEHRWGGIPFGFTVVHVDGNPFNNRMMNLIILSQLTKMGVEKRIITVLEALKIDMLTEEVWFHKGSTANRKPRFGLYTYGDIADLLKFKRTTGAVRMLGRNGCDIGDFRNVMRCILKRECQRCPGRKLRSKEGL